MYAATLEGSMTRPARMTLPEIADALEAEADTASRHGQYESLMTLADEVRAVAREMEASRD